MTDADTQRKMARLADEDLLRIAHTDREGDYLPGTVAAARAELARRDVPEEERTRIQSQIAKEQRIEANRHEQPLTNAEWALFLLLGFIWLVSVPALILMGARGYHLKVKQAIVAIFTGYGLYALLALVLFLVLSLF